MQISLYQMVKMYEKISTHSCSNLMQGHMIENAKIVNLNVIFLLYIENGSFVVIMGKTLYCAILIQA